ncbi:MAG TPA: hypothetical protein VMD91_07910 [Candidatus Sulfotelmatobacter sp.]|nr:hypothetical protein [Candidatus Sulfotelmatobacter sp.]
MLRTRFATTLALTALIVAPAAAQGPGSTGLSVTPGKVDITVAAAGTYNVPLTVRNNAPTPTHVVVSLDDFRLDEGGNYAYVPAGSRTDSDARWLAVNPREFDVAAGAFQQVQLTLSVPRAPLTGEYAGALLVQTRQARRSGGLTFSARIATKVYATIDGTAHPQAAVTGLSATQDEHGMRYHLAFRDTGNTHLYVKGRIEVRRGEALVQTLALPASMLVERGGERTIELSGARLAPALYEVVAILDYGGATRTGGRIRFDAR